MGRNTTQRQRSHQELRFAPGGKEYAETGYGAGVDWINQRGLMGPEYGGPMVIPYSAAQADALSTLRGDILGITDVDAYGKAARAGFQSSIQNIIGPEIKAGAFGRAGYGSSTPYDMARALGPMALALETDILGRRIGAEESMRGRAVQYGTNVPAFLLSADPEQFYQQQLEQARYAQFLKETDPVWAQTFLSAIPTGTPLTFSSSASYSQPFWQQASMPFFTSLGQSLGGGLGQAMGGV